MVAERAVMMVGWKAASTDVKMAVWKDTERDGEMAVGKVLSMAEKMVDRWDFAQFV